MIKFALIFKTIWRLLIDFIQIIQVDFSWLLRKLGLKHMHPKDVATQYYTTMNQAFVSKMLAADKLPLSEDVMITGPNEHVKGKEQVIAMLKQFIMIMNRFDFKKQFTDETGVCTLLECVTSTPAGSVPTVEWMEVKNGKIYAIHLYYDTGQWKQTE